MSLVQLKKITHYFRDTLILENVSFDINRNATLGLIGDNGCGKSTLLNIINGEIKPTLGDMIFNEKLEITKLNQKPRFTKSTVYQEIRSVYKEIVECEKLIKKYEEVIKENNNQEILSEYYSVLDKYNRLGGYQYEHNIDKSIRAISWDKSYYQKNTKKLSGGEKTRLELAKLLISDPDILLLDEPSNHMDNQGINWLKKFINNFSGSTVLVSHDRDLLDSVCDEIVEIDNKTSMHFSGNYTFYIKEKDQYIKTQRELYKKQKHKLANLTDEIQNRKSWFQKGQRTKDKDGNDLRREVKHHMRTKSAKQAKIIKSKERQKERIKENMVDYYSDKHRIRIDFDKNIPIGSELISLNNMSKRYGNNILFSNVNLTLQTRKKIALIGKNGSGKSTFLKMLLKLESPSKGLIKLGSSIKPAYLDQELSNLDPNLSAFEQLQGINDITPSQTCYLLARLHIYDQKATKPIKLLSVGEKMLVSITKLLIDDFNLLILDEPTNHLDIAKREVLEESLKEYPGSIIFVSHDKYFAKALAEEILYIEDKKVKHFRDSYTSFLNFLDLKNSDQFDIKNLKDELLLLKMSIFSVDENNLDESTKLELAKNQKRAREIEKLISNK